MRRVSLFLLCVAIFLASCTSSAPAVPTPIVAGATSTLDKATDAPASPTSTLAASTSTPILPTATTIPPEHWYWVTAADENTILAVDLLGNRREIGILSVAEQANFRAFPVDNTRAVLFTEVDSSIQAFLLTAEKMQPIDLPSLPIYDNASRSNWSVPLVHGSILIFYYVTQTGYASHNGSAMANRGSLVRVDLATLTGNIIDEDVNNNVSSAGLDESRLWAHTSEDGRFLRYLNGDRTEMSLRELDVVTGEKRTIYTTTGHVTSRILGSLDGEMWRFSVDEIVINLDGERMDFPWDTHAFSPMRDGKALIAPYKCDDDCELKVISPFTEGPETIYRLPWSSFSAYNPLVNQIAPDGSLIFQVAPLAYLASSPALRAGMPTLQDIDELVFRLTPDGKSRVLGILDFTLESIPVSTDGQYLLLKAVDRTSIFLYDVFADRIVVELPLIPDLDYFQADAVFHENGIFVNFTASTPEDDYREFYLVYSFNRKTAITWDDTAGLLMDCEDFLGDASIVCWSYDETGMNSSLVRYDPWNDETTLLLENAVGLTLP